MPGYVSDLEGRIVGPGCFSFMPGALSPAVVPAWRVVIGPAANRVCQPGPDGVLSLRDTISHHAREARCVRRILAVTMGLAVGFGVCPSVHAQETIRLGEALVLETLPGDPDRPLSKGEHLFTADRGSRKGQYAIVRTDGAGAVPRSNVKAVAGYTEWHLLGADKVGALPDVDVLGIHYTKVRPDRREPFERFVAEKIHPAVGNLRPDIRVLYYRLADGTDSSNYIALFALTRESRDKYWPKGADSAELRGAFSPAIRALAKELSTYLVEGSYASDPKLAAAVFESREWTDFVLVSPAAGKDGR